MNAVTALKLTITELGPAPTTQARRYVVRRARLLNRMDLIPSGWRSVAVIDLTRSYQADYLHVLEQKLSNHNATASPDRRTKLAKLKVVYRRGLEAYAAQPRSGVTSDQFAQTRVTRFLRTLAQGIVSCSFEDTDLLPAHHPLAQ